MTIDPDGAGPIFETPTIDGPRRPRVHPVRVPKGRVQGLTLDAAQAVITRL